MGERLRTSALSAGAIELQRRARAHRLQSRRNAARCMEIEGTLHTASQQRWEGVGRRRSDSQHKEAERRDSNGVSKAEILTGLLHRARRYKQINNALCTNSRIHGTKHGGKITTMREGCEIIEQL